MRKLSMLLMALALAACGPESKVTPEGKLVIENQIITSFQVDGSRCVMASGYNRVALSCDHTYALRQGERP